MQCFADTPIEDFARAQSSELVASVVENIYTAADNPEAEAVHKLRVSIRRLQQSLRLFKQFFPKKGSKQVRKQMRAIMQAAGELRNRDIALALLKKGHATLCAALTEQRVHARRRLVHVLTGLAEPGLRERWLVALQLQERT